MNRFSHTLLRNALFNVLRSGAGALLVLLLPPLLTRLMDRAHFSAWAIVMQFASYVMLFEGGLQTAIAQFVSRLRDSDDAHASNRLLSTSFALLTGAGVLGCGVVVLSLPALPLVLRGIPAPVALDIRHAVLILSIFYAVSLPLSTFTAALLGIQRGEHPAIAVGTSKLLGGAALVLIAWCTTSLSWFAVAIGSFQLIGGLAQYFMAVRLFPTLHLSIRNVSRATASGLLRYCSHYSVWLLGGLLVNGLDLAFAGYFDFNAVGSYSIAVSMMNIAGTANGAIFAALVPAVALVHERGQFRELGRIVLRATRFGLYGLIALVVPILAFGRQALSLWIAPSYAAQTYPLLAVLLVACVIRYSGNPYAQTMLGTAQHRHYGPGILVEGCVNVITSILLAQRLGALGIALGTLCGAVVGFLWLVLYNIPRSSEIQMSRIEYLSSLRYALLATLPYLCILPLAFFSTRHLSQLSVAIVSIALAAISFLLIRRRERSIGIGYP
jgi:O-antigen/teichoic acid export membrane protein